MNWRLTTQAAMWLCLIVAASTLALAVLGRAWFSAVSVGPRVTIVVGITAALAGGALLDLGTRAFVRRSSQRWNLAARRLSVALLLVGVTVLVSVLLLNGLGSEHWLVVVLSPVVITLALLFLEFRASALAPIATSELDERRRKEMEDAGRRGEPFQVGLHSIDDVSCVAAPRKGVGSTLRITMARDPGRAIDRELVMALYAERWSEMADAHRRRLESAAEFLGIDTAQRHEFVKRWRLRNDDAVDVVAVEFSGSRARIRWAPCRMYDFYFGAAALDAKVPDRAPVLPEVDSDGLVHGPDAALRKADWVTVQGAQGATVRGSMRRQGLEPSSIGEVNAPTLPCTAGSVTVVVSEADGCIIGMERLGVAHAFGADQRVCIHFVGEGVLPADLARSTQTSPFLATARRAVREELGIHEGDLRVIPTGLVFDHRRWQPIFTFIAFTPLSVAEIVSSARRAEHRHETGQIVPLGWKAGEVGHLLRILTDEHPDLSLASNHAEAALLMAAMYAEGAFGLEGALLNR